MDQQENQAKTILAKKVKRQTVRYHHANPLFDEWLQEWQDQARQADSNMQYILAKARKSLQKFPLPVYCGADCKVLHYFGSRLCNMIDKKIASYELEHGTIDWDQHITGLSVRALKGGKLPTPCPVGCCDLLEFSTFNKGLVKNRQLVVREMLAKHLLQVAGLSVQKVTAIVNEAPTLQALLLLLSSDEGVEKLGALKATRSGRPLGAAVAATLRSLYFDTCLR